MLKLLQGEELEKNGVLSLALALKGRLELKAHQAIRPVLQTSSFSAAFSKLNVPHVTLAFGCSLSYPLLRLCSVQQLRWLHYSIASNRTRRRPERGLASLRRRRSIISAQGNTLGKKHTTHSYPERVESILATGSSISPLQGDESLTASSTQGVTLGWNYSTPSA